MTRDEAIYLLKQIFTGNPNDKDALNMAIEALEKYEEAYEHGYTEAESKYRQMMDEGTIVKVVRCKDCVNGEMKDFAPAECPYYCSTSVAYHSGKFFCSMGERRKK